MKKTTRTTKTTKTTKKPATKKVTQKTTKKTTTKKPATKKTKRTPNAAFMKPMQPSEYLAAVVGNEPMPRTQVVKKLWAYIKKYDLQDTKNRRNINADEKLQKVFNKKTVSMFEMAKIVNKHLK